MARASAAVVLFALVCCLLVDPYPARGPAELPPQVTAAHDPREASAEPLLPKLVVLEEVDPIRRAPEVFRCGGEDVATAVSSSSEEEAQPWRESEAEEDGMQERRPGDSGSDTDWDSDSDDEDDEGGIMGWFWRLARRF